MTWGGRGIFLKRWDARQRLNVHHDRSGCAGSTGHGEQFAFDAACGYLNLGCAAVDTPIHNVER